MTLRSLLINVAVAVISLLVGALMSVGLFLAGMPPVSIAITAVLVGSAIVLLGGLLVRRGGDAAAETTETADAGGVSA